MCTNLAFIPLVYFCYPETANLTLEEIDYLYTQPGKSARKVARELRKNRVSGRDPLEDGIAKPTDELHEHVLEK
jgi:hypothetical protein